MSNKDLVEVNASKETTVPEQAINAVRLFEIAIALGAEIPAPVGSFIWIGHVNIEDQDDYRNDYDYDYGVYQSEISAEAGLVGWILEQWEMSLGSPWNEELNDVDDEYLSNEKIYLSENTDKEIIEEYFDGSSNTYEIKVMKIQENPPERIVTKKVIEVESSSN